MPLFINRETKQKICYETYGEPSRPCLILIAGITAQLTWWSEHLLKKLENAGFYIVVFDNRDVGLSHYFNDLPTPTLDEAYDALSNQKPFQPPYTLLNMAEDVIMLMDHLKIGKAHIAGMSMGGMIAQTLAIYYTKRLSSLICIATTSGNPTLSPPSSAVMHFFQNPLNSDDTDELVARHVEQYKIYNHADDFDIERITLSRRQAYQRAHHPAGNQRQLLAMITADPRNKQLKKLEISATIIHGDMDPVFPVEHGVELSTCLANSQLHVMKNMGHDLPPRFHEQILTILKNLI